MRTLYLDCSFGVSGDMLISSLLGHLKDEKEFRTKMEDVGCPEKVEIVIEDVKKYGFRGKTFRIICENNLQPRHLDDIINIIKGGNLSKTVQERAISAFIALAKAESRVHGIAMNEVHFHEIGAMDTIFDIVGFYILLDLLHIDNVVNTPVNLGTGTFVCEHGTMPVPGPAVLELVKGRRVFSFGEDGERATPTGVVLLNCSSEDTYGLPAGKIETYGCGFGEKHFKDGNYLRSVILMSDVKMADTVYLLECNIDDMTGESLGFAFEKLLEAGALDVWQQPVHMKKNRVGIVLSVLCKDSKAFTELIFKHTTTIGIRVFEVNRRIRGESRFEVRNGIRVKITGDMEKPEFEDVKREAEKQGASLREVYKKLEENNER